MKNETRKQFEDGDKILKSILDTVQEIKSRASRLEILQEAADLERAWEALKRSAHVNNF